MRIVLQPGESLFDVDYFLEEETGDEGLKGGVEGRAGEGILRAAGE